MQPATALSHVTFPPCSRPPLGKGLPYSRWDQRDLRSDLPWDTHGWDSHVCWPAWQHRSHEGKGSCSGAGFQQADNAGPCQCTEHSHQQFHVSFVLAIQQEEIIKTLGCWCEKFCWLFQAPKILSGWSLGFRWKPSWELASLKKERSVIWFPCTTFCDPFETNSSWKAQSSSWEFSALSPSLILCQSKLSGGSGWQFYLY